MTDPEEVSALDLVLQQRDDWRIHGVTLAGREDDGTMHLLVLRSKVGQSGLLLSLRYFAAHPADRSGHWSRQGVEMVVNGELTQAMLSMLASADAAGLAGEQGDVVTRDVTGGQSEQDPDSLLDPLAQLADDGDDPDAEVECLSCGGTLRAGDAIKVDMAGNDLYRHKGDCPDGS